MVINESGNTAPEYMSFLAEVYYLKAINSIIQLEKHEESNLEITSMLKHSSSPPTPFSDGTFSDTELIA